MPRCNVQYTHCVTSQATPPRCPIPAFASVSHLQQPHAQQASLHQSGLRAARVVECGSFVNQKTTNVRPLPMLALTTANSISQKN